MKNISLCIPTYNSSSFILESFSKVIENSLIDEVIISDDNSDDFKELEQKINSLNNKKIKLFKNEVNLKAYKNKYEAVKRAKNEWVILLDSDNIIDNDYIEALYKEDWNKNTIYCPGLAYPNFNYSHIEPLGEITIDNCNFKNVFQFETFLNTGNYFFNREEYLDKHNKFPFDPILTLGLDVIFYNTNWIVYGNKLKIIKGLKYFHRIRTEGFYTTNESTARNSLGIILKNIYY